MLARYGPTLTPIPVCFGCGPRPWVGARSCSEFPPSCPCSGAVYLLYRAARELFGREVALLTAIVFCLHPIIIFASIDIRPYAFAALAINASILALVCLRHNNSNWLAALFGLSAACIVQFQLLFAVILPALLVICFIVLKIGDRKTLWRQLGVALPVFAVAFLPVNTKAAIHGAHQRDARFC